MKFLLSIMVTLLISGAAYAADFEKPLVQGQIMVRAQAAPSRPGDKDTVSLGAIRIDTGELIFCAPAGPGATVSGMTSVLVATSEDIFIVFHAFPDAECKVLALVQRSIASADRYRVIFGAPGQPLLLELVPLVPGLVP